MSKDLESLKIDTGEYLQKIGVQQAWMTIHGIIANELKAIYEHPSLGSEEEISQILQEFKKGNQEDLKKLFKKMVRLTNSLVVLAYCETEADNILGIHTEGIRQSWFRPNKTFRDLFEEVKNHYKKLEFAFNKFAESQ